MGRQVLDHMALSLACALQRYIHRHCSLSQNCTLPRGLRKMYRLGHGSPNMLRFHRMYLASSSPSRLRIHMSYLVTCQVRQRLINKDEKSTMILTYRKAWADREDILRCCNYHRTYTQSLGCRRGCCRALKDDEGTRLVSVWIANQSTHSLTASYLLVWQALSIGTACIWMVTLRLALIVTRRSNFHEASRSAHSRLA